MGKKKKKKRLQEKEMKLPEGKKLTFTSLGIVGILTTFRLDSLGLWPVSYTLIAVLTHA